MVGGWFCCCQEECIVLADDFNRTASTDIGSYWEEMTGDSEIVSNELMIPAQGLVATADGTGETEPWMRANVTCINTQPGKTYRILCNYKETPESYYSAELRCEAAGVAHISVIEGATTVRDTYEGTYTAGSDMSLVVCRTKEGVFAGTDWSVTVWYCVTATAGRRAGLSNESASLDVEFEDFQFMRGEAMGVRCFVCECECEGQCLPDTLTLTINATGACECIDNTTITLTRIYGEPTIRWEGSGTVGTLDNCEGVANTADFILICDGDYTLQTNDSWLENGDGWTAITPAAGMSYEATTSAIACDPLQTDYPATGVFSFTMSPPCPSAGCNCEYTITITE